MQEIDFKKWLELRGAKSKGGRSTRSHAVRTIEENLTALGFAYQSLEQAWQSDQFQSVLERLLHMKQDAQKGGQDYRILMPKSQKPLERLGNWSRWLGQYGRFLAGDPATPLKDADRIRLHALEHYIEPAREAEADHVDILVSELHDALGLNQAWPNVCQALSGAKLQDMAQLPPPQRIGAEQSPATVFRFSLSDTEAQSKIPLNESVQDMTADSSKISMPPENLILYGPPGTGKTYATATEALRLCNVPIPLDRTELMRSYQYLVAAGRIEFITFHQSTSYEDFIEGRQPVTGQIEGDTIDGNDIANTGFRLEPIDGIFRRIVKRAEESHGTVASHKMFRLGDRNVFKMSIGDASRRLDDALFDMALREGFALLGFYSIDWSDEAFSTPAAFQQAILAHNPDHKVSLDHGAVTFPHAFRNKVQKGDLIVVSKGNSKFRAIGEVIGDYEYHPNSLNGYDHKRAVNWLWSDLEGVAVEEIHSKNFMMHPIYGLYAPKLNVPALEHYINSQNSETNSIPEPFVLIIDEINRANISKVFGELITLLEPDKRLGQDNALTVRLPYSGQSFGVPSNLHILGTMNTADRSIALLDTALRRRFMFREMMPDPSALTKAALDCGIDLPKLLSILNERIEYLYDREHQIGHAYFSACRSSADVDEVMRHKVIPLLAEYFFEDWSRIASVLGDLQPHEGPIHGGFLKRSLLKAPPGLEDEEGLPRFRWALRTQEEGFSYKALLAP